MATLGQLLGKKQDDVPQKATLGSLLGKTQTQSIAPLSMGMSKSTPATLPQNYSNPVSNALSTVLSGPVERAKAVVQSVKQGSLAPLKQSFSAQAHEGDVSLGSIGDKQVKVPGVVNTLALGSIGPSGSFGEKLTAFSKKAATTKSVSEIENLAKQLLGAPDDIAKIAGKEFAQVSDSIQIEKRFGSLLKERVATQEATPLDQRIQTPESTPSEAQGVPPKQSLLQDDSLIPSQESTRTVPLESTQELSPYNTISPSSITNNAMDARTLAKKRDLININKISVGDNAAGKILSTLEDIRPALEEAKGKPLTNAEVLQAAQSSEILRKATSREATLKSEAALLATRQNLAAMAEGKGVTKDFIDQLRIVSQEATRRGRELQALGIGADPIARSTKGQLVQELMDLGIDADELIKAAENVDFNNLKQVTAFYRAFVSPTFKERLEEYRYINLLSSPKTHIVNAFSNALQATVLNPATRLATGAIDFVMSGLTGAERQVYTKEVAPYGKGVLNALPQASKGFYEALKGNIYIERPDVSKIPTGSKLLKPFQVIPRTLEGMDVFFRTLIEEGEKQAIAARYKTQGKELTDTALSDIAEEARKTAEYYVFRGALDSSNATGQGKLLSAIDKATSAVYQFRHVPGVKWFIPFVQTPMNILKQGLEYSPLGIATLPGAASKQTQVAKSLIGSMVFLGAGSLAVQGKTTWSAPTTAKEKEAFYNSGRQPYSVKIGDSWVSYSKLGPLAYPMAMAAALQWYARENPKAVTQSTADNTLAAIQGIAQFFSDQSYMQGMKTLMDFASGESKLTGVKDTFASTVGQVVPLSSLLRWANQVIDPVYRKPRADFDFGSIMQGVYKDIPGLSKAVPQIEGSTGRQNPVLNAFSPIQITDSNSRYDSQLKQIRAQQRRTARLKALQDK